MPRRFDVIWQAKSGKGLQNSAFTVFLCLGHIERWLTWVNSGLNGIDEHVMEYRIPKLRHLVGTEAGCFYGSAASSTATGKECYFGNSTDEVGLCVSGTKAGTSVYCSGGSANTTSSCTGGNTATAASNCDLGLLHNDPGCNNGGAYSWAVFEMPRYDLKVAGGKAFWVRKNGWPVWRQGDTA